ncbi:hypothetical protein AFE02nite_08750 [Actinotalea fermentans]|uniref:HTH tetR-type domain-containing protein n=1 Tax=Actinotalea fermentans TaxID=43671 RepID=A0A511YVA9_9CELL|nr:hypothetical protein AFE02nite_08750 [Actinotalea fermentans]
MEPAAPGDRGRRAAPMSPEDRRDAIVGAAIPLLRSRGAAVTTRELADAACVAEGTLFRVFPDKAALVRAAIERALDPTPALEQLAGVERELPVRIAIAKTVAILQEHAVGVASLVAVSHEMFASLGQPTATPHGHGHPGHAHKPGWADHPVEIVVRAVANVLDPHAAELRLEPALCARMLVGFVLTINRPLGPGPRPVLGPHDLATLFCDGAVRHPISEDHTC